MKDEKPWHEQEKFWEVTEAVLFRGQRMDEATGEVDNIIALLDLKPKMHILDLCCGIGRHVLELARRGYHVTGVDRTASYLAKAAEQAKAEGLDIELVHDDMRAFCQPNKFDVAINMFTSFGYFDDAEDDRKVIKHMHESLKSGGMLLIHTQGKEILARNFREREWAENDGVIMVEQGRILDNWSRIHSHWTIFEGDKRNEVDVFLRLYSASELSALLTGCGFKKVDIYGSLTGDPYDHKAKRLVAAGWK
jgi:cyclopropane fatty-acyl-phospholipid synthase-like methyltransferase